MSDRELSPRALANRAARRAAAGALAAELGHELQAPLNLFRLLAERLAKGQAPDAEDISLLLDELGRLGKINARLRELSRSALAKAEWSLDELLQQALSCSAAASNLQPPLEIELGAMPPRLLCDKELLGRALAELIDNAIEARETRAGVRFEAAETPALCVWDDGAAPLLPTATASAFGATTRPGAAGLGLTMALRIARAHGFLLHLQRHGAVTEARLSFPLRDLRGLVTKGAG